MKVKLQMAQICQNLRDFGGFVSKIGFWEFHKQNVKNCHNNLSKFMCHSRAFMKTKNLQTCRAIHIFFLNTFTHNCQLFKLYET